MRASDPPQWKNMPVVKGMPHGTAWGLFDSGCVRDEVGTLNLLTPEVVVEAGKEIKTGKSVILNWGLEHVAEPGFGRIRVEHNIIDWRKTQHYYSYEGERGEIVGRGVLLDYCSWAERQGIQYNAMSRYCITVKDLETVAKEEGLVFKPGDLLIVQSGWIKWYNEHDEDRIKYIINGKEYVCVEGSEESVEWLWSHYFSGIAGDAIGFEAWPPQLPRRIHDHIALWGMASTPWMTDRRTLDLEALAKECEAQKYWSFFFSSAPLNLKGGVSRTPNALAVFEGTARLVIDALLRTMMMW
ncbi:uncharacterized protein BDR25DRAFT_376619 [Lindgomyces ingoldianus]|uniref:Uncharacterized protein n=1 Tax=Lindgomyces ingoldianus TaxID=673940 RepID=A0ACB6QJG2_9PLEO|nr:uncharacterized protein BDR25DRAFT_376619 [Lindgomyces ingoldianus]KAF2467021.1 hypothetical protein BDR25DRAFT_376619 [Lindgomyces ingoldianus]